MTQQANRAGRPWQRKDGRWAARAYPPDGGKPKMVYGTTEEEVIDRQYEAEHGQDPEQLAAAIIEGTTPAQVRIRETLKPKPVRVTLNIPPELYRQLRKWTDTAADEIGAHQVSQQDAVRAMIAATVLDKSIGLVVVDLLRREHP
jgi:hypothetical protein